MTKVLIYGDVQLRDHTEFSRPTSDGLTTFLHYALDTFKWMEGIARENNVEAIVDLGDVFEYHDHIEAKSMTAYRKGVIDGLSKLVDECHFTTLLGNHDTLSVPNGVHTTNFISNLVTSISTVVFPDGTQALCLPYGCEEEEIKKSLLECEDICCAFSHLDIQGCMYAPGHINEDGIDPTIFGDLPVFNGHIHHPGEHKSVVLVGSCLTHNFGDSTAIKNPRGCIVFDTITGSWERYVNPHLEYYVKTEIDTTEDAEKFRSWLDGTSKEYTIHAKVSCSKEVETSAYEALRSLNVNGSTHRKLTLTKTDTRYTPSSDSSTLPLEALKKWAECNDIRLDQTKIVDFLESLSLSSSPTSCGHLSIGEVKLSNFMSSLSTELDLSMHTSGLHLIAGKNGYGKSSVFDALCYALSDTPIRKVNKDDLISWDTNKDMQVSVQFNVNGDDYTVNKYRGHTKYKNKTVVYKSDRDITERTAAATNKIISNILPNISALFKNTVYISFNPKVHRNFVVLTEAERLKVLEDLIDLSYYEQVYKSLGKLIANKKESLVKSRGELESSIALISSLDSKYTDKKSELDKTISDVDRERKEIESKRLTLSNSLEADRRKLTDIEEEMRSTRLLLKNHEVEFEKCIDELSVKKNDKEGEIKKEKDTLHSHELIESNLSQHIKTLSLLSFDCSLASCPKVLAIEEQKEDLEEIKQQRETALSSIEKQKAILDPLVTSLERLDEEIKERVKCRDSNSLRCVLDGLEIESKALVSSIHSTELSLRSIDESLIRLENSTASLKGQIQTLEETLETTRLRADSQEKRVGELEKESTYYETFHPAFSKTGVRSFMLDGICSSLSEMTTKYATEFYGRPVTVEFSNYDEQTKESGKGVQIIVDGSHKIESYSSGETRRIELATHLALKEVVKDVSGFSCNITVLDEVFESLDLSGKDAVVDCLKTLSDDSAVYVISHDSDIKGRFNSITTVVKGSKGTEYLV